MIEIGRSTYLKGIPDLTLIGVRDVHCGKPPSILSYPGKFNADARPIWEKMLRNEDLRKIIKDMPTVEEQWQKAVNIFLNLCERDGVLPFLHVTDAQKNINTIRFLTHARIALVEFIDKIGILEKVKIRKVERKYTRSDTGLKIVSWGDLRPVLDPTFENWLLKAPLPHMHKVHDRYIKVVQPHVVLWVKYLNPQRVTIGYDIVVASSLSIPGKDIPTIKDVDNFIDRQVWLPIVRSHRFDALRTRLF